MRAVYYKEPGGADKLILAADFPAPKCPDGAALVRVAAASVNPVDWKLRTFGPPGLSGAKRWVPGADISGTVESAPEGSGFAPGDRVYAMLPLLGGGAPHYGALQELAAVPTDILAKVPAQVTMERAAAVPLAALTAVQSFERAGLSLSAKDVRSRAGATLLVHAGAGGVGSFAIQLAAKVFGLRVATTCSARNAEYCTALGAEVCIDYNVEKFEDAVRRAFGGKPLDYVFDLMGGDYELRSLPLMASSAHYMNIMNSGWQDKFGGRSIGFVVGLCYAAWRRFVMQYITGPYYHFNVVQPSGKQLQQIAELLSAGTLSVSVEKVYPLASAAAAHDAVQGGHVRGKVVLRVGAEQKGAKL